ncbi:hypothetical protein ADT26_17310 [Xanthomonas oryzae]|nr:hypothetical protein AXO1947_16745 [Xanthomonas oryzae pv. oryzae]KOR40635.1 hypothetical protein ADT26_17310 [Xanthomonas oryzae]
MIVDGDMDILPSGSSAGLGTVPGEAMTGLPKAPKLFDVQMQHAAGLGILVAHDRGPGFQFGQGMQAGAAHDARDGAVSHLQLNGNLPIGGALSALLQDLLDKFRWGGMRTALWARRAVLQTIGSQKTIAR